MSAQRAVLSPKNVQILFPCGKKALDIALAEESFLIITHSPGFFHCNLLKSQSKFSLYLDCFLFVFFIVKQIVRFYFLQTVYLTSSISDDTLEYMKFSLPLDTHHRGMTPCLTFI